MYKKILLVCVLLLWGMLLGFSSENVKNTAADKKNKGIVIDKIDSWKDKVVVLNISGAIMPELLSNMSVELFEAIDKAENDKASLIVLEIDTPGGEVDVCDRLSKKIFESRVPVVALIVHKAVSGGAMIAAAAPEIVMTEAARLGDVQPMLALGRENKSIDERTEEKIETDIRKIFAVYAEKYNRPVKIFESMVSRKYTLYMVEVDSGEIRFFNKPELELYENNIKAGREKNIIKNIKLVKNVGDLLMLTASEAVNYHIATQKVKNKDDFYKQRGIAEYDIVRPKISEGGIDVGLLIPKIEDLGLPIHIILLLAIFLIIGVTGLIAEASTPGFGIPGAIGIIGLTSFFILLTLYDRGSPFGIALFIIGMALLIIEIVVIPGFGVPGITGILAILIGLFLSFTSNWGLNYQAMDFWQELTIFSFLLFVVAVGSGVILWLIAKYASKMPFLHYFYLDKSLSSGIDLREQYENNDSINKEIEQIVALVGKNGVAITVLRPAGKVKLESGEVIDVTTAGEFIEAQNKVVVKEAGIGRVVVTKIYDSVE